MWLTTPAWVGTSWETRHSFGTYAYQATKDIRLVQKQLGHSKLSTTAIYADCTPEVITRGMDDMERLTRTLRRGRPGFNGAMAAGTLDPTESTAAIA